MMYDPYDPKVLDRIRGDLAEIRELADYIKTATHEAENLMLNSKVDNYEWERCMNKIHDARRKIRWIICERKGRFAP